MPGDRHTRGIVPQLPVAENVTLTIADRLGRIETGAICDH